MIRVHHNSVKRQSAGNQLPVRLFPIRTDGSLHFLCHATGDRFRSLKPDASASHAHAAIARTLREGPGPHLTRVCPIKCEEEPIDRPEAERMLMDTFVPHIRNTVSKLVLRTKGTWDFHEIDDLVQTVGLKVLRFAPRWNGDSQFTTWLHRITMNVIIDRIRHDRSKKNSSAVIDSLDMNSAPDADPAVHCEQKDSSSRIIAAVDSLSPKLSEIMHAWIHHQNLEDVSRALRLPIGTVKSRLSRARDKLEAILNAAVQT